MSSPFRNVLIVAALLASAPAVAAELYKWVDENGVTNYSNTPPATTRTGKPPAVVEDRISVYTPEKSVTEAIERDKERRAQPNSGAGSARQAQPERKAATAPPPPPVAYDPCANPNDPACQGYLYDNSPVFHGRRRHVPLAQPQIPPGTIAGHAAGPNAYIPGQSASAPPAVPPATPPSVPMRRPVNRDPERMGFGR